MNALEDNKQKSLQISKIQGNQSPKFDLKEQSFCIQPNTTKNGYDTARTLTSIESQQQFSKIMQSYSTQCETAKSINNPANLSQIKTELKDKIQSTRDRFNQLKQRKRLQQQTGSLDMGYTQPVSIQQVSTNVATARGPIPLSNMYMSFRSNSGITNQQEKEDKQNKRRSFLKNRDESYGSDNVDRDEETLPVPNLNMQIKSNSNSQTLKKPLKNILRQSLYKSQTFIPSYKLDGAKLIANRLQIQLKKRFELFCQVMKDEMLETQQYNGKENQRQLQDKWRFVRNVMDNMEKHKKIPLQDKTNNYHSQTTQHSAQSNFNQIQQMFENFKTMRASSTHNKDNSTNNNNNNTKQKTRNQENSNPNQIYSLQNVQKISSRSKDALKKRSKDLPPYLRKTFNQTNTIDLRLVQMEQPINFEQDSFASTFRENEFFMSYNNNQDFPQQIITSRSNLLMDDEIPEGLQQLPLESPMNADKFIQRRQYLMEDQQQQKQIRQFKNTLTKLANIQNKLKIRQSFVGLKNRCMAHGKLNKLVKRRIQEDKIMMMVSQKKAFVRFIKNCIFKSKFQNFIERAYQRLLEKAFDKIKENNWIVEERKEILQQIICKSILKNSFISWKKEMTIYKKLQNLITNFQKCHQVKALQQTFLLWKSDTNEIIKEEIKLVKLQEIIDNQQYKRQGFLQFKSLTKIYCKTQKRMEMLLKILEKQYCQTAFKKWKQSNISNQNKEIKQSILTNLFSLNQTLHQKQYFIQWKQDTQLLNIRRKCAFQESIFLIVRPLLRQKERRLKQQALSKFKQRVIRYKRLQKQLKFMLISLKNHQQQIKLRSFYLWKKQENQKHLKMSYLEEESVSNSDNNETIQKQDNTFIKEEMGDDFTAFEQAVSENNCEECEQSKSSDKDFDELGSIRQLSYGGTVLLKESEMESMTEEIPTLRFSNKKRVSEGYGKCGKTNQNLRYL